MRTELDHLPANKQRELERLVQIIFEEFEDSLSLARHEWKKKGRIQKVILYGSYARGGWVDEPHTAKGYQSDYDLLIIVNDKRLTDRVTYWAKLEARLYAEQTITKAIRTPINFIVHTLQEVNDGLAHGRYFFMDVARDGIALYESDDTELHKPKPKTPAQALAIAQEYFDEWMQAAVGREKLAKFCLRVPDACRFIGVSRSTLYVLIADREVEVVKLGSSTLVLVESLRRLIEVRRSLSEGAIN